MFQICPALPFNHKHSIGPARFYHGVRAAQKETFMENETVVQMYMEMTCAQLENTNRWLNLDERQKLTGRICSFCEVPLPRGTARRQAYCEHCPPTGAHRILMDFRFLQRRWSCEFRDLNAGGMLPARLSFKHAESLYALARRGRGFVGGGRTAKLGFFNAIGNGRGAISLTLDESQYLALCARSLPGTARTGTLTEGK